MTGALFSKSKVFAFRYVAIDESTPFNARNPQTVSLTVDNYGDLIEIEPRYYLDVNGENYFDSMREKIDIETAYFNAFGV